MIEKRLRKYARYLKHLILRISGRQYKKRYSFDFQPEQGQQSTKAERLVKYCLGEFNEESIVPCSGNRGYRAKDGVLLLESNPGSVVLSDSFVRVVEDQKKVVEALISQRAVIPPRLRCWLIRGDGAGRSTLPEQGLHISGMRRARHRHLVLVPTACRDRFQGPNLKRQMKELRQSWVPWEEKSDTAWWGGALTGDSWLKQEPRTLTRREVLYHFRDNPSNQVRLCLTQLSKGDELPQGLELQDPFTKRSAFMNKCLVLLPGNDIASGSSWYFAGNSVVLMPKPHLEHILYFEMNPWEHYVPLENDPADILVKLQWVLDNQDEARRIVDRTHERLRWLCGPEYLWACNEVLRRIARPESGSVHS